LDPQIGSARQNAFRERQDALYVEFFELKTGNSWTGQTRQFV
jgi:hypothetical protein